MDNELLKKGVNNILAEIKRKSFVAGYEATDTEAMGLLISKFFEWNGIAILDASAYALEDANFHTESEHVRDLIETTDSFNK